MSGVDLPVYLVAFRDEWATSAKSPAGSVPAFGTREEADAFAKRCWEERPDVVPFSLYRIVEFRVSGVIEARFT